MDENAPILVAKAGIHDDPHHGHLDAGSFLFYYKGESLIKDLGRPVYDEEVFDTARWNVVHCNSLGHNVVFVNGEAQLPGSAHYGKVEAFVTGDKADYVRMDLTQAYAGKELKSWLRHIVFHKPGVVVLLDEVKSAAGAEIECRFHPGGAVSRDSGTVLIKGQNGMAGILPFAANDITIQEATHAYLAMQADAKMEEIPYVRVITRSRDQKTCVLTVILPLENAAQLSEARRKSKAVFDKNGITYTAVCGAGTYSGSFVFSDKGAQFKEAK
jgi:hypothetical protein